MESLGLEKILFSLFLKSLAYMSPKKSKVRITERQIHHEKDAYLAYMRIMCMGGLGADCKLGLTIL